MRLDKYLKVARIIKRRTVANEACDAAHVTVNGKPAKASYEVREGDVLEITFGARTLQGGRHVPVRGAGLTCSAYAAILPHRIGYHIGETPVFPARQGGGVLLRLPVPTYQLSPEGTVRGA